MWKYKKIVVFFMLMTLASCQQFNTVQHDSVVEKNKSSTSTPIPPKHIIKQYSEILIHGRIDGKFYQQVKNIDAPKTNVMLLSQGGASQYALLTAEILAEMQHKITIMGFCLSACAELLLPAADNITFAKNPLIGFHGNTLASAHYVERLTGNKKSYCAYQHSQDVKRFYKVRKIQHNFWKEQYKYLKLEKVDIDIRESCNRINYKTKNFMWFPTSEQLRNKFGLKFEGSVCADFKSCYEKKLAIIYPPETSLAVGDVEYVIP